MIACFRHGCTDAAQIIVVKDGDRVPICAECFVLRARLWPTSVFQFKVLA